MTVQLCLKDTAAGCCSDSQAYYDNIKITTTEVDPAYVAAQEEAERQAEQETADAEKAADAATEVINFSGKNSLAFSDAILQLSNLLG